MKISIEIDDAGNGTVTTEPSGGGSGAAGEASAPADVLARAQAMGAIDGGPAPTELPQDGAPPIPATIPGQGPGAPAAGLSGEDGAISAGAAPGADEVQAIAIEQDPDAPSAPDEGGMTDG